MRKFIAPTIREYLNENYSNDYTITSSELLKDGYAQFGNWFIKGIISINMTTKEIKSNTKKLHFSYTFDATKMTVEKANELERTLNNL